MKYKKLALSPFTFYLLPFTLRPFTLLPLYLLTLLPFIFSACSGTSEDADMDWKLFRGNSELSGYTSKTLPKNPVLKWSYKADMRTVSSPIVSNGTTYWCNKRGKISGIDINGKLVFEFDMETAVEATPIIFDSILYIGRIDGIMTAISLTQKKIVWTYETMGQLSAPPNIMNFGNRKAVVFGSYDNFLYCVDAENGKLLNKFESGYYLNGAAALWKNHVVFGGCDAYLRVINCETSKETDTLKLNTYIPCSPAISGNFGFIGDHSGNIYEFELENGKIKSHKKIFTQANENASFVSVPAVSKDAIYFYTDERNLTAIDRKDGKTLWKVMLKGDVGESAPVVCNDKIIVCTKTGIVSIFDTKTGNLLWDYDTGEQIIGSPAIIKDHFLILTSKGTLLCFGKGK